MNRLKLNGMVGANSAWRYGEGNAWVFNTLSHGDQRSESPLIKVVDLRAHKLAAHSTLDLSLQYSAWQYEAGTGQLDDLFIHVWGLVDRGRSSSNSLVANLSSSNGNVWGAEDADFDYYNLKDGVKFPKHSDSDYGSAAIQLSGLDTGTSEEADLKTLEYQIDLSGFSKNKLRDYDYLVVAIARNTVAVDALKSGRGFAVHELRLSMVDDSLPVTLINIGGLDFGISGSR